MKKTSLPVIFDSILTFVSFFLVSSLALGVYFDRVWAQTVSLLCAFTVSVCAFVILNRKNNIKKEKKADTIQKTEVLNQLCIISKKSQNSLLQTAFENLNIPFKKHKSGLFLTEKNALCYPLFIFDEIRKADVIKAFNKIALNESVYVLGVDFTPAVREFSEKFKGRVILIDGDATYSLLKDGNSLPEITVTLDKGKSKARIFFRDFFSRKRASKFFVFGASFFLMSLFVPFKFYYCLSGATLLIFGAVCLIKGKPHKTRDYYFQ